MLRPGWIAQAAVLGRQRPGVVPAARAPLAAGSSQPPALPPPPGTRLFSAASGASHATFLKGLSSQSQNVCEITERIVLVLEPQKQALGCEFVWK